MTHLSSIRVESNCFVENKWTNEYKKIVLNFLKTEYQEEMVTAISNHMYLCDIGVTPETKENPLQIPVIIELKVTPNYSEFRIMVEMQELSSPPKGYLRTIERNWEMAESVFDQIHQNKMIVVKNTVSQTLELKELKV